MTERKTHLDTVAVASLVGCCLLWGLNQVAAKVAIAEMPPLHQAGLRSIGAALLVWAWSRWRGIALFERDGTLPGGLLAGALFAAEFACIFIGLQYTTASRMVVFLYTSPFVVALGMPLISRAERLSVTQVIGLLIAFAGAASAFAEGFTQPAAGDRQWIGDTLAAAAAVLWGATTLAIRATKLSTASPEKTLLYQLGLSGVVLTAAALAIGAPLPKGWAGLSTLTLASLAFQTIVVAFASFLLWFWLMRRYPATRMASFTLLTPVFGLVFGALLLNEPITTRLLLALLAVSAGIVLVNRSGAKRSG